MALKHSLGLRNFCLDTGMQTAFETTGRLNIYSGTQPANADTNSSGTLLATLTLSAGSFSAATGGGIALAAVTSDTSADATGTAGWFRFYLSAENPDTVTAATGAQTTQRRLDGTIGTDMAIDNASIVAGGTVALSGWTYNYPA
jgi:hypothetical protein